MEWLPRLYDKADSLVFACRLWWAGYGGQAVRSLILLSSVLAASAVDPIFRSFVIATIGSFMFAELLSRTARVSLPLATRQA